MDGIEKYIFNQSAYEEMVGDTAKTIRQVLRDQFNDIKLKAKRLSDTTTMSYEDALDMLYERWLKGGAE